METGGRAFVAVDVHYLGSGDARAAAVLATDARFCEVVAERPEVPPEALPYRPGEFYRRELPPIRAVLSGLGLLVVGYADLNPAAVPAWVRTRTLSSASR
jgi:deoxyribonuclease V